MISAKDLRRRSKMKALNKMIRIVFAAVIGASVVISIAVLTTGCGGKDKKNNRRDRDYLRDFRGRTDLRCRDCGFSSDRVASVLGRSSTPQNGFQLTLDFYGDYVGNYSGFTSGYSGGIEAEGYLMVERDNGIGCY